MRGSGRILVDERRLDWRLFGVMYAIVVAVFAARAVYAYNGGTPLLADTDDAMRLVVVRDFLAGQGWYDNVQHRLNAPFGAELHWSRLADLPLAGLILIFRPMLGPLAETAAAVILPLLLLFVLLYLSGRITLKLVGPEGLLPAYALPAFSLSVLGEFAAGRIDHHSLQMLLLLTMLWCSIEALTRPRFAIGAGIAAATAIAVGIEGVPAVAAAILAFGLMWVSVPARADALRWFGLSFALATLLHVSVALPPAHWFRPACDALSFTYASAAIGVGAAFGILSLLPVAMQPVWVRFALGVGTGACLAIALAFAFPDCLRGPYAMLDPWLVEHWIDRITEAAPLWQSFLRAPVYGAAIAIPPVLALAVVLWLVTRRRTERKGEWLIYLSFLALAVATMLLQVRASRMATVIAVPAGAWLIVAARHWYLSRSNLLSAVPLVLAWIGSAGLGVALVATAVVKVLPGNAAGLDDSGQGGRLTCFAPAGFAQLDALPPARIMAPVDLGAHVLAFTPHEVVAAPYHRNEQGVRDAFDFFNAPVESARAILDRRGATLVVICPQLPEMRGLPEAAEDSFVELYAAGRLPDWLRDESLPDATLRVFAVEPRR
jgi:hypothetical protein